MKTKLAWFYVPLWESEYPKLLELFKDRQWVLIELFDLGECSNVMFYEPEERRQCAHSSSGDRSLDQTVFEFSDEWVIVQLIRGIRFNDTSDSHWKYWGVAVMPRPGREDCEAVANRLSAVLGKIGIGEERMQKAYFDEETKQAFTQLESANNL